MKRKARLNVYSIDRSHRQEVLKALSEATALVAHDRSIEGVIILITDSTGQAQVATGGRLDDRAQAAYHTSMALRWNFLNTS